MLHCFWHHLLCLAATHLTLRLREHPQQQYHPHQTPHAAVPWPELSPAHAGLRASLVWHHTLGRSPFPAAQLGCVTQQMQHWSFVQHVQFLQKRSVSCSFAVRHPLLYSAQNKVKYSWPQVRCTARSIKAELPCDHD